jgi:large subunit ribosomal protein L4
MASVIDPSGKTIRDEAIPAAFSTPVEGKRNAMFRAVFRELSNRRAGTASTLRRDEVRGGGRKPWRQKGTGRARQGSIRSPQWTHGGVVFGPKPKSFAVSLNKKERRAALHAALCDRFQSDCITVLATDGLSLKKTNELAKLVFGSADAANTGDRTLLIYAPKEADAIGVPLERTARNLKRVAVTHLAALDVKDVLGYSRLWLTAAAFDELGANFADMAAKQPAAGA